MVKPHRFQGASESQSSAGQARKEDRRHHKREHDTATDDPHFVPAGNARKTREFFPSYGWRERHYTMKSLKNFLDIVFRRKQTMTPEDWDPAEMAVKRTRLNALFSRSDALDWGEWGNMALFFTWAVKGMYAPSELVNKLDITTQEEEVAGKHYSIERAAYSRPIAEWNEESALDPDNEDEATACSCSPATASHPASNDNNSDSETDLRSSDSKESHTLRVEYEEIHGNDYANDGTASGATPHPSQGEAHRWMSDNRVCRMSDENRAIFAERKFREQPAFSEISDLSEIPPHIHWSRKSGASA